MRPKHPAAPDSRPLREPFAAIYFFPFAAAYAALLLPWSVLSQLNLMPAPPGLLGSVGHAHEMLFGYALAVVAGYILGPQPRRLIRILLGVWLAARIAYLMAPASLPAAGLNILFAAILMWRVVPRFTRSAKKWRNKAVAPLIIGLGSIIGLFHMTPHLPWPWPQHSLLFEAVLLLSGLMFFMGGRMIAPAIAGHLLKKGRDLEARVQPRIEGAVIILGALALIIALIPTGWARQLVGLLLLLSAGLTIARIYRWQIWHVLDRPDLLALSLGYLWLAIGWVLVGSSLLTGWIALTTALHAITIGALGTLTLTVMARTRLQRTRRDPNSVPVIFLAVGLLSLAAVLRLAAGVVLPAIQAHLGAAAAWSLAYGILVTVLIWEGWRERKRE